MTEKIQESAESNMATISTDSGISKAQLMASLVNYAATADKEKLAQLCQVIVDAERDSKVPGPTVSGNEKNLASIKSSTAPGDAMKKVVKEEVDEALSSLELSEEFKTKASTLFEAAVNAKTALIEQELKEKFDTLLEQKLTESFTAMVEDLVKDFDAFASYVAEEWLEKNELALESTIKTELAESFMNSLRGVFEDHYIDLPESKVDLVETLADKIEELEEELQSTQEKAIQKANAIEELKLEVAKKEINEGLTDLQREKLLPLLEAMTYTDSADFVKKAEILKESIVSKETKVSSTKTPSILTENIATPVEEKRTGSDPIMASYVSALSRTIKR